MMKKFIYLFIYLFIYHSCKSQEIIVDNKKRDIITFKFNKDKDTKFMSDFDNTKIYENNTIIVQQKRMPYGSWYFDKYYTFIKEKDTMNIMCYCGQNKNYYFKNLVFKKGNYELSFDFAKKYNKIEKRYENDIKYTLGNLINTPKEAQNILFKDTYISDQKPQYKDVYFKDLKLIEIDLNDTINVKMNKVDKFQEAKKY